MKFGYVVYSDGEAAEALYRQGSVLVRRAGGQRMQVGCWPSWWWPIWCCMVRFVVVLPQRGSQVRVKRMDGLPAQFDRN